MRNSPRSLDDGSLQSRLKEAVDVSGAFHNCFFHCYAAYLLANNLSLPSGLFHFKSLLGPQSPASQLQKIFRNKASLDLFAQYEALTNQQSLSAPHYMVEKTLILGCLLREWFASKLVSNSKLRKAKFDELNILEFFKQYSTNRQFMIKKDILSQEVALEANEAFLEYSIVRPKESLSPDETRFEQYFTMNTNVDDAYTAYWEAEGYQHYCKFIAQLNTTISPADMIPVLKELNQPTIIYNKSDAIIASFPQTTNKASVFNRPQLEIKLDNTVGHYYLLKTTKTTPLLDEYQKSYTLYKADKEDIISLENNPLHIGTNEQLALAHSKKTLLVGAICPQRHITWDPFVFLIEKTRHMKNELLLHKPDYSFLLKAGAASCALGSIASAVIGILAMAAVIGISTTGIGLAVGIGIAAGLTAYGLFMSTQSKPQSPTTSPEISGSF